VGDQILVVDGKSKDGTADIARQMGYDVVYSTDTRHPGGLIWMLYHPSKGMSFSHSVLTVIPF